ncbi:MAG TPA: PhoPQ-activated pathogenicity-related family protein [Bryobacteraceae bacterium]|nr:PhoPQ-activated pathogenicity-related family protein [Bryobacteraceae bacterium]
MLPNSRFRILALLLAGSAALQLNAASKQTALDRYVAAPDSNYKYELVNTIPGDGYTTYVLDMTSQQYLTSAEVDKPIWHHWVTIVRPDTVTSTTGFLYITGGSNTSKPPQKPDPMIVSLATASHSVASELRMIPSEPLTFTDETKPRSEDGIIAYTWNKYLRTGDEKWPLRLPMTKASVRALDTITAFCKTEAGGKVSVEKFMVAGGSKRGWTTWTTAAVDKRVVAITPFVIDMLNVEKSFEHHYRAYGFWAPAVKDYQALNLMDWSGTPQYKALMQMVEPYSYRDRLTMPKFLINAGGDQFFLPDSSQFYWDDLKGEKHIRYVPNTDHSLRGSDAQESMQAFYEMLLSDTPRPKYSWRFEKDGSIHVQTITKPTEVKLWQITNPKARDFRLESIGPKWTSAPLAEKDKGLYVGKVDKPAEGWTAYFVEVTFPTNAKYPMKVTSGVRVAPDTLPYGPPPKHDMSSEGFK